MTAAANWFERHQVVLAIAALVVGGAAGLLAPGVAGAAEAAIPIVLVLLMYATFLGVPFRSLARALADWRFLAAIGVVNFIVVPLVVFAVSRFVAHDQALLVGVLFVLLTPCIDYVVAFTGLAGGAKDRLLAAAPLLLLGQFLLLPVYLGVMLGPEFVSNIDPWPFLEAFRGLIAAPLIAAGLTQFAAARIRPFRVVRDGVLTGTVPLMMATLAVVVASQIAAVGAELSRMLLVVPVFVVFALVMVPVGVLAGRAAGLDAPGRRAVTFSGVTRNSLVVLPLVLALPSAFDLAPLVVVTQTLVELVLMIAMVHLIPRVVRERATPARPRPGRSASG